MFKLLGTQLTIFGALCSCNNNNNVTIKMEATGDETFW